MATRFRTAERAIPRLFVLLPVPLAVPPTPVIAAAPLGASFFREVPVPALKQARWNCAPAAPATPESSFLPAPANPTRGSPQETPTLPVRRASPTPAKQGPCSSAQD